MDLARGHTCVICGKSLHGRKSSTLYCKKHRDEKDRESSRDSNRIKNRRKSTIRTAKRYEADVEIFFQLEHPVKDKESFFKKTKKISSYDWAYILGNFKDPIFIKEKDISPGKFSSSELIQYLNLALKNPSFHQLVYSYFLSQLIRLR